MKPNWLRQLLPPLFRSCQPPGANGARNFSLLLCFLVAIPPAFAADTAPKPAFAVNLPTGWEAADIGLVRKPGSVRYDAVAKSFTVRSIGEVTEKRGTFGYTRVKGDFVATCRVTAASTQRHRAQALAHHRNRLGLLAEGISQNRRLRDV